MSKRKVGSIKPNGGQRGVSRSGRGDDTPRLNPASDPPEVKEHPVKNKLNKLDEINEAGGAKDPRGTRPKWRGKNPN